MVIAVIPLVVLSYEMKQFILRQWFPTKCSVLVCLVRATAVNVCVIPCIVSVCAMHIGHMLGETNFSTSQRGASAVIE